MASLALASTAEAAVLHVPGDFPTIQSCIDAAFTGDECLVAPGTYNELINFHGKAITLRSSDGPEVTIIDASPVPDPGNGKPVVRCSNGEGADTVLDGFTISGGTGGVCFTQFACGGGIYNTDSGATVTKCIFTGNSADFGGGMYNSNSHPTVTHCNFSGNSAEFDGAGIYNRAGSSLAAINCAFSGNSAVFSGGGVHNQTSSPTLINCTFSGNTAADGGAMCSNDLPTGHSSPVLANTILWGNTPDQIANQSGAVTTVTYSNVQGGWPGEGNIDADPRIVDADGPDDIPGTMDDNLRLSRCSSPCVDAGDNAAVPIGISTDIEGSPRFVDDVGTLDTGNGAPPIADMGALELQQPSILTAIHVPDDFVAIQAGIDNACDGEVVIVAPGTYTELINFHGKAITLRSSDGPEVTIIDAAPVPDPGTGKPVVRCTSGEGPDTVLDGFTLTGGMGSTCGTFQPSTCGAGMFNDGSSPTVTNCIFTGNSNALRGGGLYSAEGDPTVTNCVFSGNSAVVGAGMYISEGTATVTDCTFEGNVASVDGGGLYNFVSSPTVTNCAFAGNSATGSGGGMYNRISNPTVSHCTFFANAAAANSDAFFPGGGGGMANSSSNPSVSACTFTGNSSDAFGGGMLNEFSDPTVANCTLDGNSAEFGGGMYNTESSPTVRDCMFSGNSADFGGGMRNVNFCSPTVINCVFSQNTVLEFGGGMANRNEGSPTITDCTFAGNTAADGGGMYNRQSSHPTATNCTFWRNSAENGGGGVFATDEFGGHSAPALNNCVLWGNAPDQILGANSAVTTVSYSNVQGGWHGVGNIDADPLFADADGPDGIPGTADDDLRLSNGSPCIDAGDNAAVPLDVLTDLAGRPRFFNDRRLPDTGNGQGPIVDMGAYEYGAGACMDSGDLSVVLCHQSPESLGRPKTITASVHDALDHFAHGDTCGACSRLSTAPKRLGTGR